MIPSIRTPRWTAAVVFAVLSVGHALVLPTFEGMDEPAHLSSILQFATGAGRPEPDRARLHQAVESAIALAPGPYHQWPDLQTAIGATGYVAWRQLPGAERARRQAALAALRIDGWSPGIRENWQAQHPPLYYALVGRLVGEFGDRSFVRAHRVARLASALLFSTTGVLLTAFLTGAWGASPRAALFVVLFPMWYVMGARIANDALAIPALGLACLLAVDQLRRSPSTWSWTSWLAAGAAGALALAAKAYGLVFVPVAVIAALVAVLAARRGHASWTVALAPLAAVILTLAVNGWWLAENLATTGFITGQNENADLLARGVVTLGDRLPYARHLLVDEPWTVLVTLARAAAQALFVSNWTFGAAPPWFYPLQVGTLVVTLRTGRGPLGPTRRAAVTVAAVTAGAIVVGSAKAVVDFYILFGETRLAQGWYVWGAGVAVAAALALVFDRAPGRVQTVCLALQLVCLVTAFVADAMYWSGRYDRHPTWRTPVAVADASSRPGTLGLAVRSLPAGAGHDPDILSALYTPLLR